MRKIFVHGHEHVKFSRIRNQAEQLSIFDSRPACLRNGLGFVVGEFATKPRGHTFVEQDSHLSGGQHPFAGFFEEGNGLFVGHGGEILQKIVQRLAAFEVINQRAGGDARAGEARRAAHDFRVNHHDSFRFHGGNITQHKRERQGGKYGRACRKTFNELLFNKA